jgi:hypothetical protein
VDATSVELGIGPECREHANGGISDDTRCVANQLIFDAALAAQTGKVTAVLGIADAIEGLGLAELAGKIRERFTRAVQVAERNPDITIVLGADGAYRVNTPFRRGSKEEFIAAWRAIPGRRFDRNGNVNVVPASQKPALWALLRRFFPGKYGKGPSGVFRVPVA